MSQQPDKLKLKIIKEEVLGLAKDQTINLKQHISETIKAFNYKDLKLHGHLNELLLTVNTDNLSENDNFFDIQKKLIYLIDTIISDY